MIRKFILFLLITSFLGCKNSKAPKDFFIPIFQENSNNFKSNYSSGIYSKDSIILKFSCENQSLLKLICGNDTVFSKENIQYKLRNLKPKLMYIPTASKKYSSYANNWIEPNGSFSSFQKIKLYQIKDNLILDSIVFHYILGAISETEIPLVNLTIDPKDLFRSDSGCYVPGNSFIKEKDQITGNFYKFNSHDFKEVKQKYLDDWQNHRKYYYENGYCTLPNMGEQYFIYDMVKDREIVLQPPEYCMKIHDQKIPIYKERFDKLTGKDYFHSFHYEAIWHYKAIK